MGHSHALSGLAAGAATLPFAPVHHPAEQVAWVAAWGGFALLPDLDSGGWTMRGPVPRGHGSTVARMWGPLTTTLSAAVGFVARGHRNGTHDVLLAPLVFGAVAWAAAQHPWSSLVGLALAVGLALHACHFVIPGNTETTVLGNLAISAAAAWWLTDTGHDAVPWLPVAVAGGVLVHVVGDSLTVGGVPVPFTWVRGRARRWSLRLFRTGATVEKALVAPVALTATVLLLAQHTGLTDRTIDAFRAVGALGALLV
ncbi:metal-dependent hydrolase [Thalassiella azotivora]